jgi:cytidine deaminase
MNNEELAAAARAAAEKAYAPYSNFRVGVVVVTSDGEVFTGANVENAAYPASSCAEDTAITTAAAQGVRKIEALAVACIDATDVEGSYPCGRCRQVMSEFDVEKVIVTSGEGSEIREHTLDELLPHRFHL